MKTFISYRHTGEDPAVLKEMLTVIRDGLVEQGVDAYCTFFEEEAFVDRHLSARDIMDHAFAKLDDCDFMFCVITTENKSEGMLMEIGYCVAKGIPVVVAIKQGIGSTYVPQMANQVIEWDDVADLASQIKSVKIEAAGN